MAALQRVGPDDILPNDEKGTVTLSPLQQVSVRGAIAVGCLGAGVLIFLLGRWVWVAPHLPVILPGTDDRAAKLIIENYKALREAALDDTLRILDAFVIKLLLPLFTSFVGYIFGSQMRKDS